MGLRQMRRANAAHSGARRLRRLESSPSANSSSPSAERWESASVIRSRHAGEGSRQRVRHAGQRDSENSRDFAVGESLGSQVETLPVLFGQGAQYGLQALVPFLVHQTVFGVRVGGGN